MKDYTEVFKNAFWERFESYFPKWEEWQKQYEGDGRTYRSLFSQFSSEVLSPIWESEFLPRKHDLKNEFLQEIWDRSNNRFKDFEINEFVASTFGDKRYYYVSWDYIQENISRFSFRPELYKKENEKDLVIWLAQAKAHNYFIRIDGKRENIKHRENKTETKPEPETMEINLPKGKIGSAKRDEIALLIELLMEHGLVFKGDSDYQTAREISKAFNASTGFSFLKLEQKISGQKPLWEKYDKKIISDLRKKMTLIINELSPKLG